MLKIIDKHHKIRRTYRLTEEAHTEFGKVRRALRKIDIDSNLGYLLLYTSKFTKDFVCRNEVTGMTSKACTNILKIAPVYACCRQVTKQMDGVTQNFEDIVFELQAEDIANAWEVVKYSMHCYQQFKV